MLLVPFVLGMVGCAVWAAVCDVRMMRIPNVISLILLVLFVPAFFLGADVFGPWWHPLAGFGIVFALTFVFYLMGGFGGGDTKLASTLALWVGLRHLFPMFFYVTIAGGVLATAAILIRKHKPFADPRPESWIGRLQAGERGVPYGVALSFGALMAFPWSAIVKILM